ncbi:putative biopolymer transport protein [Liberibacter crescens BT-1]|uniref:Putative biopolymer transport protein n=1 Tax=Liberibacter crescens (strain BT-1) TaxID=1215343 RepID=L0EU09_LIBCB|nr:biopolymer transporter ExbD [Liberibacter crescens]AGA64340.1 putative biopolymer transport protein [Liberibacter crescens BT-1]AMC12543.1 biopolymer transporter ExbD [Liberibacter crescens]
MGMVGGIGNGLEGENRRKRARKRRVHNNVMSEINITPLVDVMLVLLIVFMVAAPMMTVGVPIDLPKTNAKNLNSQTQPITISVKVDGSVFLQETAIPINDLADKLKAVATTGYTERIFVRGDSKSSYGIVADVMARIQEAGYKNIALVTQQKKD